MIIGEVVLNRIIRGTIMKKKCGKFMNSWWDICQSRTATCTAVVGSSRVKVAPLLFFLASLYFCENFTHYRVFNLDLKYCNF